MLFNLSVARVIPDNGWEDNVGREGAGSLCIAGQSNATSELTMGFDARRLVFNLDPARDDHRAALARALVDLDVLGIDERRGELSVRFVGSCANCPYSLLSMEQIVKPTLLAIPGIERVVHRARAREGELAAVSSADGAPPPTGDDRDDPSLPGPGEASASVAARRHIPIVGL